MWTYTIHLCMYLWNKSLKYFFKNNQIYSKLFNRENLYPRKSPLLTLCWGNGSPFGSVVFFPCVDILLCIQINLYSDEWNKLPGKNRRTKNASYINSQYNSQVAAHIALCKVRRLVKWEILLWLLNKNRTKLGRSFVKKEICSFVCDWPLL